MCKKSFLFAFCLLIVTMTGCGNNTSDSNSSGSTSNASASTSVPQAAAPASSIDIGDTFQVAGVSAVIESVHITTHVGSDFTASTASQGGEYVAVLWKYKNISNSPISAFDTLTLILLDPTGTEYDADVDASASYAADTNADEKVLSDLNPGITVTSADVYEVSKKMFDKNTWSLAIQGEDIKISLSKAH